MKKLLFLLILFSFSCKKEDCQKCTCKWNYNSYRLNLSNGNKTNEKTFAGPVETFYECDEEAQKAAEKGMTTHSETISEGFYNSKDIIDGTATCSCE